MRSRSIESPIYRTLHAPAGTPGYPSAQIIKALTQEMGAQDPRLRSHGLRTARYAVKLGEAYGFSPGKLRDLAYAGLLHDIGQLTLPEAILRKDGPLTAEEYVAMQCHPRAGAELLARFAFLQRAALWIAHHHERWDGSGYPYGLRGRFIPLGARILAVADAFDAIVAADSRQSARATDAGLRILQVVAGSQLDPHLVEIFVGRMRDRGKGRSATVTPDSLTQVIGA